MRFLPLATVAAACAACMACGADAPIRWDPEMRGRGAMVPGARMVFTDAGIPAVQAALEPLRWPEDSLTCGSTRVAVPAGGGAQAAVWWRTSKPIPGAPQGQDTLLAARTPDGIVWEKPVPVAIAAARGCRSAPAALAVDSVTGTLHIGFYGQIAGQAGVGVARLEPGAAAISGVALVAADRVRRLVAIAARGDTVAVAHEAPAPSGGTVRLAISGHKSQFPVDCGSPTDGSARGFSPVVALTNGRVAVGWNEARRGDRMPVAVARVGEIRRACEPSRRE